VCNTPPGCIIASIRFSLLSLLQFQYHHIDSYSRCISSHISIHIVQCIVSSIMNHDGEGRGEKGSNVKRVG
jgi:hypothetical protein